MKQSVISMPSAWGRNVEHRYYWGNGDKLVVLFPGKAYSCDLPLLHYAAHTAFEHNFDVLKLEYGFQSARTAFDLDDLNILLYECKNALGQIRTKYKELYFVSKSMGTVLAGEMGAMLKEEKVRQFYLTPLDRTIPFMISAECTAVYGTADPVFSPSSVEAAQASDMVTLHPIEGADHMLSLRTARESLAVLQETCVLYDRYFAG